MSLWQAGTQTLSWRETLKLVEHAASDPATPLGAALGGLRYPATHIDILNTDATLALAGVSEKERHKILPFGGKTRARRYTSRNEYEQATAAMLTAFGIQRQGGDNG